MKSLVAGLDEDGRSCVVATVRADEASDHSKSKRIDVFEMTEMPPPAVTPGAGGYHDVGLLPGHMSFCVLVMPSDVEHPMHHTDTLNFHTVVSGSVELVLDDGAHLLGVGDSLVLPGVDHGWRAGPSGCTMTILNVGSARHVPGTDQ